MVHCQHVTATHTHHATQVICKTFTRSCSTFTDDRQTYRQGVQKKECSVMSTCCCSPHPSRQCRQVWLHRTTQAGAQGSNTKE
jgi:hypothetical protein